MKTFSELQKGDRLVLYELDYDSVCYKKVLSMTISADTYEPNYYMRGVSKYSCRIGGYGEITISLEADLGGFEISLPNSMNNNSFYVKDRIAVFPEDPEGIREFLIPYISGSMENRSISKERFIGLLWYLVRTYEEI